MTIFDDELLEGNESFLVTLERTMDLHSKIILTTDITNVTIIDDERMLTFTMYACLNHVIWVCFISHSTLPLLSFDVYVICWVR